LNYIQNYDEKQDNVNQFLEQINQKKELVAELAKLKDQNSSCM